MGRSWCTTMIVKEILCLCLLQTAVLSRNVYPVPNPYRWDESFTVEIPQIDDEHVVLFDNLRAVEEDPNDEFLVGKMKHTMKEHFSHEEVKFCDAPEIDWDYCMDHKRKHTHFNDRLDKIHAPADVKEIKAAQAWLAQHIKNTDFAYRG